MLFVLALSGTASAVTLSLDGWCGGPTDIDITGLTPDGPVAILAASFQGSAPLPGGPCAGLASGLDATLSVKKTATADGAGEVHLTPTLPVNSCGMWVQVVDARSCEMSNTVFIPTGWDADGDGYDLAIDCDDEDPTVYPGAPELCDRQRNDCNGAWAGEDGVVTFSYGYEEIVDLTSVFQSGTPGSPRLVDLGAYVTSTRGDLNVCAGTYHVDLTVDSDMEAVWVNGIGGSSAVTLDGTGGLRNTLLMRPSLLASVTGLNLVHGDPAGLMTVETTGAPLDVTVRDVQADTLLAIVDTAATGPGTVVADGFSGPGLTVQLDNHPASVALTDISATAKGIYVIAPMGDTLTLTGQGLSVTGDQGVLLRRVDGTVDGVVADQVGLFPGLWVDQSSVALTDVQVSGGGDGGVFVQSSTLSITDGRVSGNTVTGNGGGLSASGSNVDLVRVDIDGNFASGDGGGLYLSASTVDLVDSNVSNHVLQGTSRGGGAYITNGSRLNCASDQLAPVGFTENSVAGATQGGAAYLTRGAVANELTSDVCTWGRMASNNSPEDISLAGDEVYNYAAGASFACLVSDTADICQ